LTYFGLMRIPPRVLFTTTTALITLLAAGMATQAVAFLERANWLTSLDTVVWGHRLAHSRDGYRRADPAYPDRLHRSADRNAASGLRRGGAGDLHADAADRIASQRPRRRRRLTLVVSETILVHGAETRQAPRLPVRTAG